MIRHLATTISARVFRGAILLLLSCVIGGCRGPERVVYRGGTTHFPLLDGREMKYEETVGGKTKEFTVKFRYMGGRAVKSYEAIYRGLNIKEARFHSDGRIVEFSTATPRTKADDLPEYRELWLDEEARTGDTWDNYDTGTQTSFAGYETITVAAGQFVDCYRAVTSALPSFADTLKAWRQAGIISQREYEQQSAEGANTVVRWFAEGIGLVKEQHRGSGLIRELVEVVQTGTGLMDTAAVFSPNPSQE